ncbi:hypothetical protein M8J75_001893 [Diaphorina citri]|nr:hypothetical protein M8J75_001893 [Diaphorina citri]
MLSVLPRQAVLKTTFSAMTRILSRLLPPRQECLSASRPRSVLFSYTTTGPPRVGCSSSLRSTVLIRERLCVRII